MAPPIEPPERHAPSSGSSVRFWSAFLHAPSQTTWLTKPLFLSNRASSRPFLPDLLDPTNCATLRATPPGAGSTCHVELALDWLFARFEVNTIVQHDSQLDAEVIPLASLSISRLRSISLQIQPMRHRTPNRSEILRRCRYQSEPTSNLPTALEIAQYQRTRAGRQPGENDLPYLRVEFPHLSSKPNPITVEANAILPGASRRHRDHRRLPIHRLRRSPPHELLHSRHCPHRSLSTSTYPPPTASRYLPGTGDAVPEALASINLQPDILTVSPTSSPPSLRTVRHCRSSASAPTPPTPDLHGAPTQALHRLRPQRRQRPRPISNELSLPPPMPPTRSSLGYSATKRSSTRPILFSSYLIPQRCRIDFAG